tara:strand:+ start:45 stop:857 length:813 start_codon:yes stop_codon:yes gene_type:complete
MDKTFIRFFGMRRSGIHGLNNWLISHLEGRIFYVNDAQIIKMALIKKCSNLNCLGDAPKGISSPYSHITKGNIDSNDCVFLSYEDRDFLKILATPPNQDNVYGEFDKYQDIFLIRNPYNLFCSRAQRGWLKNFDKKVALWKEMARNLLKPQGNEVGIYYDDWHVNLGYRKDICKKLGLEFHDRGKHLVSGWGGGSSFDGTRVHPDKMNVLDRTAGYKEAEFYLKLLEDAELNTLYDQIKDHFNNPILSKSIQRQKLHSLASSHLAWPTGG